jgi:Uma2 family endonuclease
MIAVSERTQQQIVLHDIRWDTYESLLRENSASHYRMTYDEGELEIMTLSVGLENLGSWLGRLIFFLALEFQMAIFSGGSATLKQGMRKKGLEPDECFWIAHEEQMRGKKEWDAAKDPPPDLAVEIDITSSSLDRLGIYAALKVPEIWRYDGELLQVLVLGTSGKYKEKAKSPTFPPLPLAEFAGFVGKLGSKDEVRLIQEFTLWLRTAMVPRREVGRGRKNGQSTQKPSRA